MGIRVRQEADLQFLDLPFHHFAARQHHRYHDERGVLKRDTILEVHLGQRGRGKQRDNQRVHDLKSQLTQRECRQRAEGDQHCDGTDFHFPGSHQRESQKGDRQGSHGADVCQWGVAPKGPHGSGRHGQPRAHFVLEFGQAFVEQVVGNLAGRERARGVSELCRRPGDFDFPVGVAPPQALYLLTALVARGEVASRIDALGVGP